MSFRSTWRRSLPLAAVAILSIAAVACEDQASPDPAIAFLRITAPDHAPLVIEPNGAVVNGPLRLPQHVPTDLLIEVLDAQYQPVLGEDFAQYRVDVVSGPGVVFAAPTPHWTPQGHFRGTLTVSEMGVASFAVESMAHGRRLFGPFAVSVGTLEALRAEK